MHWHHFFGTFFPPLPSPSPSLCPPLLLVLASLDKPPKFPLAAEWCDLPARMHAFINRHVNLLQRWEWEIVHSVDLTPKLTAPSFPNYIRNIDPVIIPAKKEIVIILNHGHALKKDHLS